MAFKQRRRNFAGYLHLKDKHGYKTSSLENVHVLRIAVEEVWPTVRLVWTLVILAVSEIYSRSLGYWDCWVKERNHVVWDMAWTTKNTGSAAQQPDRSVEAGQRVER